MYLKVLFVSHEVAPFAKVGGLADVAGSLPLALKERGHDIRIAMPAYQMILDDPKYPTRQIAKFEVTVGPNWTQPATLFEADLHGVTVYLIGSDRWFTDATASQYVYLPGSDQHLFFCQAVLQLKDLLDWQPDVIHANDWHTGFIPVLMREGKDADCWERSASIFSIHNLAYQGEFGIELLDQLGLSRNLFNPHQLETYGAVNFLKSGCVYADRVNTVSPRYAEEIQTPAFGCRLEGLMVHLEHNGRLSGILNGIDQHEFNPEIDPHLPAHFSAADVSGKRDVKRELLRELLFPDEPDVPLFGVVSRLSSQKGMDVLLEMAPWLFDRPGRLIVQGLGDPWLADRFRALEAHYPDHFRFIERFDASLAQRVYGGSDFFLMPSAFEPCGLGQLIAMRYGTVPVVRRTGGLANTVFEGENGYVFERLNPEEFWSATDRALRAFGTPAHEKLIEGAMATDSTWTRSAGAYEALYQQALAARTQALKVAV